MLAPEGKRGKHEPSLQKPPSPAQSASLLHAGGDESALSRQLPWRRLGVEGLDYYRHSEIGTERDGLVIGYASPTPSAWSAALAALIELLP